MEEVAREFDRDGKAEQAREVRAAIAKAQEAQAKPTIDFRNPTDKMKREAKERGIDLDDPAVRAELIRLQEHKEAAFELDADKDDLSGAGRGAAAGGPGGASKGPSPVDEDSASLPSLVSPFRR